MTIHLRTWGDLACFTRPDSNVKVCRAINLTP